MNIITEQTNTLLKRREVVVEKSYPSNPGIATVSKDIAEVFKTPEEGVSVKRISSTFGTSVFRVDAHIYTDTVAKGILEPKPRKKKGAA